MSDKPFSTSSAQNNEQSIQLQTIDVHQKDSRSRLLELPAELRLALYKHVFDASYTKSRYHIDIPSEVSSSHHSMQSSAPTHTIKQCRDGRLTNTGCCRTFQSPIRGGTAFIPHRSDSDAHVASSRVSTIMVTTLCSRILSLSKEIRHRTRS